MKLATFIKENNKLIIDDWVAFACEHIETAKKMSLEKVRDHISEILAAIIKNMEIPESDLIQEQKSKGNQDTKSNIKAANQHGLQRANVGFDVLEVSSEFRALRASVLRIWADKSRAENWENDFQDLMRFNEVIDELWMISLQRFEKKVDESKNWYMGVLGHDLRNPLSAIMGMQSIFKISENLSEKEKSILMHSISSSKRMAELIDNLLELTNVRLGGGLKITKTEVDLSKQGKKIIEELRLGYPKATLVLETEDTVEGEWDRLRLEQLMTNLITNAIRYGKPDHPIKIKISTKGEDAILDIHNEGTPIPKSLQETIFTGNFDDSRKHSTNDDSYGLGLYIVKEIVDGHNGEIQVTSTEKKGTNFKVILPRK